MTLTLFDSLGYINPLLSIVSLIIQRNFRVVEIYEKWIFNGFYSPFKPFAFGQPRLTKLYFKFNKYFKETIALRASLERTTRSFKQVCEHENIASTS